MSPPELAELAEKAALEYYLRALYPYLTQPEFDRKIKSTANKEEFIFFRAFVPYFYDVLRRMQTLPGFPDMEGIDSIRGWCVGDAHAENFGTIWRRSETGERHIDFTMNDPDDGGPGPLYADLLQFLTGLLLIENPPNLSPILNAYRQGLDGDSVPSPVAAGQIKAAKKSGPKPERLFRLTGNGWLKPTKKERKTHKFDQQKLTRRVPGKLRDAVGPLVAGQYRICGYWALKKRGGGSAGLRRYWILLLPKTKNNSCADIYKGARKKVLVLELKRLVRPGIWPLVCPTAEEAAAGTDMACSDEPLTVIGRVGETLDTERGGTVSRLCDVTRLQSKPFILRPRWQGNRGVKLERITKQQGPRGLALILKDEARVLGNIHSKSLPAGSHYAAHIYALADELTDAAMQLAQVFRQAHQITGAQSTE